MANVEDGLRAQIRNIEATSGRTIGDWTELIRARGLTKHREIVEWLKTEHGMTHGNANRVALIALEADKPEAPSGQAPADLLYSGRRANLRPIHDRVLQLVRDFGTDVEIAPKKGYVSLRRRKQFAMLKPAATHVDLGLILPTRPHVDRLEAGGTFNAMFTHRVRLPSPDAVDAEVAGWLREAYDAAG